MNLTNVLIRMYSLLLKLYPIGFRVEFEEEMNSIFEDRMLEEISQDATLFGITCLREFFDLFSNLFREYLAEYRKGSIMDNWIYGKFHNNLIGFAALVFGIVALFSFGLNEITGSIPFIKYTLSTYVFSAIVDFVIACITYYLFWMATPRGINKWGFLPSVLGGLAIVNLWAIISQFYVFPQFGGSTNIILGWQMIQTILHGIVFGVLFGLAYHGKKGVLPFVIVSIIGYFLSWFIPTVAIALTGHVFNINLGLSVNWYTNIGYTLWTMALVVLCGMLRGALLAWQVNRVTKDEEMSLNPA